MEKEQVTIQCTVEDLVRRNQELHRQVQQYESFLDKSMKQHISLGHHIKLLESVVKDLNVQVKSLGKEVRRLESQNEEIRLETQKEKKWKLFFWR